jgi:HEAT repeat protein
MTTFYCPLCWREVSPSTTHCPGCQADIEAVLTQWDYVEKLIAALRHPEPTAPIRAAWILGERKERRAVEPLSRLVRECRDPFIVEAAVEALGKIGDPSCLPALRFALARGALKVREKARAALAQIPHQQAELTEEEI